MQSRFDSIIDRGPKSNTFSAKWQGYENVFPGFSVDVAHSLPMWVADMDFLCPQPVIDAVVERAKKGVFGYSSEDANLAFMEAAAAWFAKRHGLRLKTEWMLFCPGILPAVNAAIQEFSDAGEGVIIQEPVYYPFLDGIANNGRTIVNNELINDGGVYRIDFADLERKARDPKNKIMVLSNPHNPVGRVWTHGEMAEICRICAENGVVLVSDEIHGDLIFSGSKLTSAGHFDAYHDNLILAHAPSKTFNLAGLGASIITIPSAALRERLARRLSANRVPSGNVFGPIAGAAAYLHGAEYVDELVGYLEDNIAYAIAYGERHFPNIRLTKPEGTYLVWADFRGTGLSEEQINRTVIERAKVLGDLGAWFGKSGAGFIRFNFACPRAVIEDMVGRIEAAFQ